MALGWVLELGLNLAVNSGLSGGYRGLRFPEGCFVFEVGLELANNSGVWRGYQGLRCPEGRVGKMAHCAEGSGSHCRVGIGCKKTLFARSSARASSSRSNFVPVEALMTPSFVFDFVLDLAINSGLSGGASGA